LQLWKIWTLRWKLILPRNDQNIKISAKENEGYYELKKHKLWFDKACSESLNQRKQAKLQWLQDPSEINGDNLNYNLNMKREYLKDKFNEIAINTKNIIVLATDSTNKNIRDLYRGIHEFKKGCQSRNNLVKDENSDLLAESHNI
jgi:hypothetical protein